MKRINNITELHSERLRLKTMLNELEQHIRQDMTGIKEDLKPVYFILKATRKLFSREDNGILGAGLNIGLDLLLKKVIFRNAGWISKLLLPFFVKNATNNIISNQGDKIMEWVKNLFSKSDEKKVKPIYDKATADINY